MATSYNNLGVVHEKLGDFEKAKEYTNLVWVLHRKSEDLRMYKRQLVTITWVVHEQLGYFEKAKKYHELALNITQKKLGRR